MVFKKECDGLRLRSDCWGPKQMIHYSCDCCNRELESDELRYVVKMEVSAVFDPVEAEEADDDRDHLMEIQDILERMDDADSPDVGDEVYQQLRFDLCPECRRKFVKNPLARKVSNQFDFSKN